jgi:tetratricopeptide (TPR) repeat protein
MRLVRWAAALLLSTATAAASPPAEDTARSLARQHSDRGKIEYELGHFQTAVAEYEAAYQALPLPAFLYNLGQAYRELHRDEEALHVYERFLSNASADDPHRGQAERFVAELRASLSRAAPPAVAPVPADRVEIESPPPPPPRRSFWARGGWLLPVAIAVVAAGVAVGIYFGVRTDGAACGTLGCFSAGP